MAKKIVLDPGHGGTDSGASGNGLAEKDLTLQIVQLVGQKLSKYLVEVRLTRTTDTFISLNERTNMANNWGADFFCSIHINAGGGTGFESYTFTHIPAVTASLREVLHNHLAPFYAQHNFPDRGMKTANFAVLRNSKMPAVLLENLFIDSPKDASALKDVRFLDALAGHIATGLGEALQLSVKPVRPTVAPTVPPKPPTSGPTATPVPAPPPHWAQNAFTFLKEKGLVTEDHALDSPISWGELATVLKRFWDKLNIG